MLVLKSVTGISILVIATLVQANGTSPLEISVTGTRSFTSQSTAQTTQTVTSEELNKRGITTLSEAIERFTGVSIARNGSVGNSTAMFVRGSNSNHVVILLDGQRLTSTTDGKTEIEYIPLEIVERIEFVPGGLSTLYGSDAIGGVLQIFTKPLTSAPNQSIAASLGDGKTQVSYFRSGDLNTSTSYRINIGREYNSGYDAANVFTNPDDDGFSKRHLDLALSRRTGKLNLTGFWSTWDGTTEFDEDLPYYPNNATDFNSRRLGAKLNYITGDFSFESQLARLDNYRKNYQTGNTSASDTTEVDRLEWNNTLNISLPNSVDVTIGFDARNESAESTYASGKLQSRGLFASATKSFDLLTLEAALRREHQDSYGYQTSWSTGLVVPIGTQSDIYASRKFAYANPTLADLDITYGNPDLLPEEAYTNEVGYRFNYSENWSGDLTFYQTNFSELIQYGAGGLTNIGNARTRGVEFNLGHTLDNLSVDLGLAYLDGENLDRGGIPLINRVAHKANIYARYQVSSETIVNLGYQYIGNMTSLDAVTYGSKAMPDYSLWNMGGTHQYSDNLSLTLDIDNLLDKDYEPVDGYNGRGRYFEARLNYTF